MFLSLLHPSSRETGPETVTTQALSTGWGQQRDSINKSEGCSSWAAVVHITVPLRMRLIPKSIPARAVRIILIILELKKTANNFNGPKCYARLSSSLQLSSPEIKLTLRSARTAGDRPMLHFCLHVEAIFTWLWKLRVKSWGLFCFYPQLLVSKDTKCSLK